MDEGLWCERVFRDHQLSVVRLHTATDNVFQGNDFIVSNNKTICDIVSCQHVVKMLPVGGTMAVYFFNSDGLIPRRYNARIIRTDEGRDLAWLRAQDVYEPVTCLRFFDPPYASGWNVVWFKVSLWVEDGKLSFLSASCDLGPGFIPLRDSFNHEI